MDNKKTKKKKIWTYSPAHSYKFIDGEKLIDTSMQSNLFSVGVYVIINNDPGLQLSCAPQDMMNTEKKLKKNLEKGIITDLVFSIPIKVTEDENGFFIQV